METFCQRMLEEEEETGIENEEKESEGNVSRFKPLIKSPGSFCIVTYDNVLYPGEILEFDEDTVRVSTMVKGQKSWKWPEQRDIIDYKWDDVVGGMEAPKLISRTRRLYRVPELDNN